MTLVLTSRARITKFAREIDPALADLVEDGTFARQWYDLAICDSSRPGEPAGLAALGWWFWVHDVVCAAFPTSTPVLRAGPLDFYAQTARVPTWTSSAQRCSPSTPSLR